MSQYYARARELAEKHGLDPAVGEALIWQESRGNPNAISPVGAIGLGQVMPKTGAAYGYSPEQLRDPELNLDLSMRIAADNVRRLGLENGLAAYNGGENRLKRAGYKLANMPSETQGFVPSILNRASQLNGGGEVADRVSILPQTMRGFNQDVVIDAGLRDGHFKSQNLRDKNPEALAAIQDMKDTQRAMLPMALASMMSSNKGQQNFGNRLYAESVQGINPMKLANGYVMDDGTYITDQDPSAYIRAQAALQGELNDANNANVLGGGSAVQIGLTAGGEPIFKGKSPTAYTYVNGQPAAYTGGVGAKSGVNATEDQAKAAAWFNQASKAQENADAALLKDPGVSKPGTAEYMASWLPGRLGTEAARALQNGNRQAYVDAASSFAEAALRAATGAGINESEAKQKIAELIPNYNDKPEAINNKIAQWPVYLESFKNRAGRALTQGSGQTPGIGAGPAGGGGGNPNDPLGILGSK